MQVQSALLPSPSLSQPPCNPWVIPWTNDWHGPKPPTSPVSPSLSCSPTRFTPQFMAYEILFQKELRRTIMKIEKDSAIGGKKEPWTEKKRNNEETLISFSCMVSFARTKIAEKIHHLFLVQSPLPRKKKKRQKRASVRRKKCRALHSALFSITYCTSSEWVSEGMEHEHWQPQSGGDTQRWNEHPPNHHGCHTYDSGFFYYFHNHYDHCHSTTVL